MRTNTVRKEKNEDIESSLQSEETVYKTFEEFWPRYLKEHQHPLNRRLHFIGTHLALILIATAFFLKTAAPALVGIFLGYAFAWMGHFFVEKNRPLTFKYPWMSLKADFKAFWQTWKKFLSL
jgi:hypothetical protein